MKPFGSLITNLVLWVIGCVLTTLFPTNGWGASVLILGQPWEQERAGTTIYRVNLQTQQILDAYPLRGVVTLTVNRARGELYALRSEEVHVLTADTLQHKKVIRLDPYPPRQTILSHPENQLLYITSFIGSGRSKITIVDPEKGAITKQIKLPLGQVVHNGFALSRDGRKLYVASSDPAIIDTQSNTLLSSIKRPELESHRLEGPWEINMYSPANLLYLNMKRVGGPYFIWAYDLKREQFASQSAGFDHAVRHLVVWPEGGTLFALVTEHLYPEPSRYAIHGFEALTLKQTIRTPLKDKVDFLFFQRDLPTLWAVTPQGTLLRIQPQTGAIEAEVKLPIRVWKVFSES